MVGLAISILPYRRLPGVTTFLAMMSAMVVYSFGSLMELLSESLAAKVFWRDFQQIGLLPLSFLYFLLAFEYSPYADLLSKRMIWVCSLVPLSSLLLIFTDPITHWMRYGYTILSDGYLVVHPTQLDTIMVSLCEMIGLVAWLIMARTFVVSRHRQRWRIATFLVAYPLPGAFHAVRALFQTQPGYDTSLTLGLIPAGLLFFWGLWSQRMFEIAPIAREMLFQSMSDSVLIVDLTGRIQDANTAAFQLFGGREGHRPLLRRNVDEMIGQPAFPEQDVRSVIAFDERWLEMKAIAVRSKRGEMTGRILVLSDVSLQYEETERLRAEALTDNLTGLVNRRMLERETRRIIDSMEEGECSAFLVMDIDDFKLINDTYGHKVGDEFIVLVAQTLRSTASQSWIVGRLGGDEFGIAIPHCDESSAMAAAERIRRSIESATLKVSNSACGVTLSIGCSVFSSTAITFEDVYVEADKALYAAKDAGKNRSTGIAYMSQENEGGA